MPDIWEQSKSAFYTMINFTMFFSLVAIIVLDALSYATGADVYPTDLVHFNWGVDILTNAVEKLKSGISVNVIVAIPQFVLGIAALIVQLLLNTITLLNWIIKHILFIVFKLIIINETSAEALSNILSWIIESPVIFGATMALGQAIYTFITGGGKT